MVCYTGFDTRSYVFGLKSSSSYDECTCETCSFNKIYDNYTWGLYIRQERWSEFWTFNYPLVSIPYTKITFLAIILWVWCHIRSNDCNQTVPSFYSCFNYDDLGVWFSACRFPTLWRNANLSRSSLNIGRILWRTYFNKSTSTGQKRWSWAW